MKNRHTGLIVLRGFLVLVACALGWFFAAQIRTMRPGFRFELFWAELGFACATAVPLGLLSALGLRWRIKGLLIGLIIAIAVLSAELSAATEELVFVRRHQAHASGPTSRFFFSENWLAYDPATKTLSGSD
jgi:hypothetical protein